MEKTKSNIQILLDKNHERFREWDRKRLAILLGIHQTDAENTPQETAH